MFEPQPAALSSPSHPPRHLVRNSVASVAATAMVISGLAVLPQAAIAADVESTGTVVVESGDTAAVRTVGTSTITVLPGTTAEAVLAGLTARDGTSATLRIEDSGGAERTGPVAADDALEVTAADGVTVGTYAIDIWDEAVAAADGDYWQYDVYNEIDATVNANTPVFPNRVCDVTAAEYEAHVRVETERYANGNEANSPSSKNSPLTWVEHDVVYYGDAINEAVQDCHDAGGGIVRIPAGGSDNTDANVYYSGSIELLSNVNLQVETGATVKFMRNKTNEYYPLTLTSYEGTDIYNFSPFVRALNQYDIAITGGGTLDGQEDMWNWRPWKKGYWGELSVEDRSLDAAYGQQGILNQMNFDNVPIQHRIFTDDGTRPATIPVIEEGEVVQKPTPAEATVLKSTFRPAFIEPNHSKNILIEDIKLRNTPFWQVHPLNSENVLVRGIDIYSNKTTGYESSGWNNDDGIDPESTKNVVIEQSKVTVSDDGVAIKAGRNRNGRELRSPSERIIVRHNEFRNDGGNSAGVSVGSEMSGGVKNVFVHDMTFGGTGLVMGFKFKTNSNRGGSIQNFYARDSVLENVNWSVIEFDANYSETVSMPNADVHDPTIRNVYLDGIRTSDALPATRNPQMFRFTTAVPRSPVANVHVRDTTIHSTQSPAAAFSGNKFIKDLVAENLQYLNRTTGVTSTYSTKPLGLAAATTAQGEGAPNITLAPAGGSTGNPVTAVPTPTFRIAGKVDLTNHPTFATAGALRIYVDRDATPVSATLNADGTFVSAPITLNDDQYWYRDRHYIAINISQGLDINTIVHHVAVRRTPVTVSLEPFTGPAVGGSVDITGTFTNDAEAGGDAVTHLELSPDLPDGWVAVPRTASTFTSVAPGQTVTTTWRVTRESGKRGVLHVGVSASFDDPVSELRTKVAGEPVVVDVDDLVIAFGDIVVETPAKLQALRRGELNAVHYVDRTNKLAQYPESLTGAVLIPGSNDDKRVAAATAYLRFTAKKDSTVYVAFDARGRGTWWPAWLGQQGFVETSLRAQADDGSAATFVLFAKEVAAGTTLTLGGNNGSSNDTTSYFTLVAAYESTPVLAATVIAEPRCTAAKNALAVTVANTNNVPVSATVESPFGSKTIAAIDPGKSVFLTFTTRLKTVDAGTVNTLLTGQVSGQLVSSAVVSPYPGRTC